MKEQEEKNIKKPCFRFYLWPDEITEQFPSHDTDGRKKGKEESRSRNYMQTRVDCSRPSFN